MALLFGFVEYMRPVWRGGRWGTGGRLSEVRVRCRVVDGMRRGVVKRRLENVCVGEDESGGR